MTVPGLPFVKSKFGDEIYLSPEEDIQQFQSVKSLTSLDLRQEMYQSYQRLESFKNPHNISSWNFTAGGFLLDGSDIRDVGNMSSLAISCGMVLGAAQPMEGEASTSPSPGSRWSIPI